MHTTYQPFLFLKCLPTMDGLQQTPCVCFYVGIEVPGRHSEATTFFFVVVFWFFSSALPLLLSQTLTGNWSWMFIVATITPPVSSHFVNSHFVNFPLCQFPSGQYWQSGNWRKCMGIDEVGIGKVQFPKMWCWLYKLERWIHIAVADLEI